MEELPLAARHVVGRVPTLQRKAALKPIEIRDRSGWRRAPNGAMLPKLASIDIAATETPP
jgi:hypothetical protein